MRTADSISEKSGERRKRGVLLRVFLLLAVTLLLVIIFTAAYRLVLRGTTNADTPFSGLIIYTLPAAVVCSFPFIALRTKKGGEMLSAFLMLIVSFLLLYTVLPGLYAKKSADFGDRNPAEVSTAEKEGSFIRGADGFVYARMGKRIRIDEGDKTGPRISDAVSNAQTKPPEKGPAIIPAPIFKDAAFLNQTLYRGYETGKSPFALYTGSLLLFAAGAFLLSSISAWPVFNFFVCVLFIKLLFFLHRFFASKTFADLEEFTRRFTRLSAVNILLLGSGLLFVLLSLFHYTRRKGTTG